MELEDLSKWENDVMKSPIPIVLDVYADWCAPCRKLTPILEEMVNALDGKVKLVKVNADTFPQLTTGLNVRALPSVFLIFQGNMVDTFSGIPSEKKLEEFFSTAMLLKKMTNDEKIMEDVLSQLESMIKEENF